MNRERWPEVKQILERALEIPVVERASFVPGACRGDPVLLREVEGYLAYETSVEALIPERGIGELALEEEIEQTLPERVGPYRVLREIGRGGMGMVYLAERDDGEFSRLVAIKLIRGGVREGEFAKLFRRERQILARFEHPNIARLLDAGRTAAGQPYYAMEFVEGMPLAEYCTRHDLPLRKKLELFLSICSAVAYAHRKLVIHRDLKPQNILITSEGTPKLLDFGLAKVLAESAPEAAATTGAMLLTPSYASPEQIKGEPLTVATDVYSLGVLLYELLSGEHPYGDCAGPIGAAIAVLEASPQPLHTAGRRIPVDLEKIVVAALRKEPERRYATVDSFMEDIRRFLAGYPVRAAGDSIPYRVHKFARRHRWTVSAGAAAAVALTISGVMTWQAKQQADLRFEQIRGLAHSVVFEIHDAIADLPGSTPAQRLLVARALHYLNALAEDRGNDPALMLNLAQSYERIGDAQGAPARPNLGDRRGALASYTKARDLLLKLRRRNPADKQVESWLAVIDDDIADVLPKKQPTVVLARRTEAVKLFEDISRRTVGLKAVYNLARAQYDLARTKTELRDPGALVAWHGAIGSFARIAKAEPDSDNAQDNLALAEKRLAGAYYVLGDCVHSMVYDRKAAAIDEARIAANSDNQAALTGLSFDLYEIGECQDELKLRRAALQTLDRTVSLRRLIAVRNPRDVRAQSNLEEALRIDADVRLKAGDLYNAKRLQGEAAAIGALLLKEHPHDGDEMARLALNHLGLGLVYRARSAWRQALEEFQRASTLADGVSSDTFADPHELHAIHRLPMLVAECRQHLDQFAH